MHFKKQLIALSVLPLLFVYNNCTGGFDSKFSSLATSSSLTGVQQQNFNKAVAVLNTHCIACHSSAGAAGFANFNLKTQDEFVKVGLVVVGDPLSSILLSRLVHYQGPMGGARNMPPMAANFTIEDYNILSRWIEEMGTPQPDSPLTADDLFQCTATPTPEVNPLNRLTRRELSNTYRDLLARIPGANSAAVLSLLQPEFNNLPADDGEKYERNDRRLFKNHVQGYLKLAEIFSNNVSESALTSAFASSCGALTIGGSSNCQRAFIQNFGLQVYRRPLITAEVDSHQSFYLAENKNFKWLVQRFLMSPEFHYHVENQGVAVDATGDLLKLSAYELASRLSYLYLETMPTPTLFQMAQTGEITTAAGLQKAIDLLFTTQRSQVRSSVRNFYSQWMSLDSRPHFQTSTLMTELLKSYPQVGTPDDQLRQEFLDEVLDLTDHYTFTEAAPFTQILTTDRSFAKSNRLASIYNVTPISTAAQDVRFPQGTRAGLFNRAALLYSGLDHNTPIMFGVNMIREFKCEVMATPSGAIINMRGTITGTIETTRDAIEAVTHQPACIGCHSKINPYGFNMEIYDFLGGYRADKSEGIFDASGNLIKKVPIDSVADVELRPGVYETVRDGYHLSHKLAEHKAVHRCFVKNVYESSMRRPASFTNDACGMRDLYKKMEESGGSMELMFRSIPMDANFQLKKVK